jgi:hypothetical protein
MGRNSKYKKKYDKEIFELAEKGWPKYKIAYHWGVTEKTIDNWRELHKKFSEAYEIAMLGKKVYWHDRLETDKFMNAAEKKMWATIHLDYSDKKEVKTTDTEIKAVTIEILEPPKRNQLSHKEKENIIDVTPTNKINKATK